MSRLNSRPRLLPLWLLCAAPLAGASDATSIAAGLRIVTPEQLFAPIGVPKSSVAQDVERERALNYFTSLELDEFTLSGFVASRRPQSASAAPATGMPQETADYRTYLGLRYARRLGDAFAVSGRTYYGSGTYSGDNSYVNPQGGILPDEVRAASGDVGDWLGTDWNVTSKLFEHHDFKAGVEYRQQLTTDLFREDRLFGSAGSVEPAQRKVDVVAKSEVALAQGLSLNTRLRYDEKPVAQAATVDPRVELRYRPHGDAMVSAVFDQAGHAPLSYDRAAPLVNVAQDFNRARNYSLAYEQSVSAVDKVRLSAFRYGVNGVLANPTARPDWSSLDTTAQIDSTGFEVGVERGEPGGIRSSISYAWQQTNNSIAGMDQGSVARHLTKMSVGLPFWARRMSTAFELQYHDIVSPLMGQGYDFVVGNLTLASGELAKDTSFSLGMHDVIRARDENVSNQLLPFIPQDGRSLRLDLKRKF